MSTCDVLVLGAGGSGLAAAVAAAQSGARVVVLEKASTFGGSTAMSVGAFAAPMTSLQRKAGVADSVEEFVADIAHTNGPLEERENQELRRLFAVHAAPTLEWLIGLGVRFLGPFPEPPHRHPRTHLVLPNSKSYTATLRTAARRLAVRIVFGAGADELLRNSTGAVIGARSGGRNFVAQRGVVIATGDYSASAALLRSGINESASKVPPVNPGNTGDGHLLGLSVGGQLIQMDTSFETLRYIPRNRPDLLKAMPAHPAFARFAAPIANHLPRPVFEFFTKGAMISWLAPSPAMYGAGAIHVSASGERIANEESNSDLVRGVAAHGDRSFMVFDATVAAAFSRGGEPVAAFPGVAHAYLEDVRQFRPDIFTEAPTLKDLATALGIPADVLISTVSRWNESSESGTDTDHGRAHLGAGLRRGPFFALGPLHAAVVLTNGGLAIDSDLRVLDSTGTPIDGLFAAGSAGQGGLQLLNNGLHIGWAMTSGRLAGTAAARSPILSASLPPARTDAPAS
ncbi:FAD-dependent oxidoreductase [Prescottella equi]|uniref:FAD-dependent oxidoreductase n=1 Tax=Rhodococcus hoagii TaxID=43767 RepID=UPI00301C11F6